MVENIPPMYTQMKDTPVNFSQYGQSPEAKELKEEIWGWGKRKVYKRWSSDRSTRIHEIRQSHYGINMEKEG